ncbi:MAG TPA: ABC transporter permease [Candidatus Acidoferrum sp.]|nr:ABC transporter permease [Candidatus Acidoferrum sp.]
MRSLWHDLRFAVRILRKNPLLSVVAVVTLALGIGANSTVFSWANATLLDPIPGMADPAHVVSLFAGTPGRISSISYPDYRDLRAHNSSFSGLTGFSLWAMSITEGDRPERIWGALVSSNFFTVLGVRPLLGRGFSDSEESAPGGAPVAVISYRLWQTRYHADPRVLGQTIPLNKHLFTIVGVTPPQFQGSFTALRSDIWLPISMQPQVMPGRSRLNSRDDTWLNIYGRLLPGVSRERAQSEISVVFLRIAQQFPDSHQSFNQITLFPLWRAPGANSIFSIVMPMLLAVAGLLLLLTCANVANLMLVRASARVKELALRLSLGASRARLVRQLLVEGALLAIAGGAAALLLTRWDSRYFMSMAPQSDLPIWVNVRLDHRVLLFTFAVSVATALLFGILPALRASSTSPITALKNESSSLSGGRAKARLSRILAVAQIALSLLLLISASLFLQSFRKAQQFFPGFNPNNVFLASYDLFPNGYDSKSGLALDRQILEQVYAVHGVQSAALADWVPLGFSSHSATFLPDGYAPHKHEVLDAGFTAVSPRYFFTIQLLLLRGRDFSSQDVSDSLPVAIINSYLANRYYPGRDALGSRIQFDGIWRTIVGIAQDSKYYSLQEPPQPFVYLPLSQSYSPQLSVHVRTAGSPLASSQSIQRAVHQANAELPLFDVGTLKQRIQAASTIQLVAAPASGVLGLLALILAAVGIYGVIAYTTSLRTQEIGIRMALGAQRSDVLRLILRDGLIVTSAGILLGCAAALLFMRLASSALFGVSGFDPATFLGIPALLVAVIFVACYLPARRAMRLDPIFALRHQ